MEGVEDVFDLSTFEPKGLFEVVDDVSETARGTGGFGSTKV